MIDCTKFESKHRNINILKRYPLEIQHPKFENSSLGLIETVHERLGTGNMYRGHGAGEKGFFSPLPGSQFCTEIAVT